MQVNQLSFGISVNDLYGQIWNLPLQIQDLKE
jgi:hypothetical protein